MQLNTNTITFDDEHAHTSRQIETSHNLIAPSKNSLRGGLSHRKRSIQGGGSGFNSRIEKKERN